MQRSSENVQKIYHPIDPVYNRNSCVLILGTMPSPVSREKGFYYAHSQNRFWKVLEAVLGEPVPQSNEGKTEYLLNHRIAMWDVLESCEIKGASDASIKNPAPNDLGKIFKEANIKAVYTTGKKAEKCYREFFGDLDIPLFALPSTSAANASMSVQKLVEIYSCIAQKLRENI